MARTCEDCRFWSEKLYALLRDDSEPPRFRCLSPGGPLRHRYLKAARSCLAWAPDLFGRVDGGRDFGYAARLAYLDAPP
jgi:hypothetical protein